ncbi:M1 family aminopeptidase [Thalassotalea ganghwensis]
MFTKMFFFEWRYFTRQPSFYVTSLIFFFLTFFATISDNVQLGGGGNVLYNGPFSITQTLLILGIFAMFLVVNFVANTATRNDSSRMAEILYSKPLNPFSYQLGRFLGAFAVTVTVFAFVPFAILVGTVLGGAVGWVDPERLGATQLSYYLTAFFYMSVPTLFVLSCLFYAAAVRFKSLMAVYLTALAIFILYLVSGQLFSEPEYRTIVALADPFAVNTFSEITRYWTMFDKNNTPIQLDGILLQNRIIWLVVGVVILAFFGGFSIKVRLPKSKSSKKADKAESANYADKLTNKIDYRSEGVKTLSHMKMRIGFEIKQVVMSAPFLVLGAFTIFSLMAPLIDPRAMFGTPNWPITQTMVQLIVDATSLLMLIVLAYYSAEIVWRERNSGMGDIVDSMPVHNITFWLSKLIAMTLVFVLLFVFAASVTMLNQLLRGYDYLEVSQYVIRLGYVTILPYIMSAVLAFFLQVISPNKFVGMMLFVLYIISSLVLSNLGFSHNMFNFAGSPTVYYSDINTYGDFLTSHSWYMLYWAGMSIILASLTYALWHRGPVQPLKARFNKVSYYLGGRGKLVVTVGLVIFIGSGAYIHYNTRVLNEYVEQEDRLDLMAEYEKKYAQYKDDHIPTITKANAKVDIYPKQRMIDAQVDISVENKSSEPITRFLVAKPAFTSDWQVIIDGGKVSEFDETYYTGWFTFATPLQPGEIRKGKLVARRSHQGFNDGSNDFALVENGTFINNYELFPTFGYQNSFQIIDRHERRKRGLEPIERANKLEQKEFYNESFFGKGIGFIDFEATISTDEDQFAIAPGYLQSEVVENGRRIFHYKMDAPIVNFYSIMSARLASKKEQYKGIDIEVYYHPAHDMNIDRMIESVRDSIDYFSENFGPYQHKQMRIIEFPGYRTFAQSFANTVPYSENIGFITDLRDPKNIDPVYYITAHEVAHQWWGHQVGAANVQGSAIISETLSQYSALMVMEKKYGPEKIRKFLKYELDRYLRGRSVEVIEEMPLMRSENQQYIHYRKGSVVMMSLKDKIGEQRLNEALAGFLNEFRYQSTPYPTTLDLLAYLTDGATEAEQVFISNLFEHITLYDLKVTAVTVDELEQGKYSVSIDIEAALKRADGQGSETDEPFEDMIDIGLFSQDPEDLSADSSLQYLQKHLIKTGSNTIKLVVDEKPKFVGVDPFVKLIDRDSADNIYRL